MVSLLYGVAVLACPVAMSAMMWMMMRGQRRGNTAEHRGSDLLGDRNAEQIAALRAEIEQLKSDRAAQRSQVGAPDGP